MQTIDVEIFRPGSWKGSVYSESDIDDLVSSYPSLDYKAPIKLGHDEVDGAESWGWVQSLRKVGDTAVATISDIPKELLSKIAAKRYNAVSAEIFVNLKRNDKLYRKALKAVAILGAQIPAVGGLRALSDSLPKFSADESDGIVFFNSEVKHMDEVQKLKEENTELQGKVIKLQADLAKSNTPDTEIVKLKESVDAEIQKFKELNASKDKEIDALKFTLKQMKIDEKVASIASPAYKPFVEALYHAVDADKVIKFAQADKTAYELIDSLVEKLNADFGGLLTQHSHHVNHSQTNDSPDVEIDKLTRKFMIDRGEKDYSVAMHAVLSDNKDLARRYADS